MPKIDRSALIGNLQPVLGSLAPPPPSLPVPVAAPTAPTSTPDASTPGGGLDPQVVNLAKAVRQNESGGNFNAKGKDGEIGAYQFMPSTWKGWAARHLGDPNAAPTPENQNQVAYKQIKAWKDQGYNVGQILSLWNSGSPDHFDGAHAGVSKGGANYDTPKYARTGYAWYRHFQYGEPFDQALAATPASSTAPTAPAPEGKTLAGFGHNVASDAGGFFNSLINTIIHPVDTISNLGKIGLGAAEKLIPGQQGQEKYADAIGRHYKERYGGWQNIKDTLYSHPIETLADLSTVAGGASSLLKTGALATDAFNTARAANLANEGATVADVAKLGEAGQTARTIAEGAGKVAEYTDPVALAGKTLRAPLRSGFAQRKAGDAAASLEEQNLRLTPTQKTKLVQESPTHAVNDNPLIRYAADQKLVGTPEERLDQVATVIDNHEAQLQQALKQSQATVKKTDLFNELDQIPDAYKSSPQDYQSAKHAVQQIKAHLSDPALGYGDDIPVSTVNDLKRGAWHDARFDMTKSNATRDVAKDAGHIYKSAVEKAIESEGGTVAGQKVGDFNKQYGLALKYQDLLAKAAGRPELGLFGRLAARGVGTILGSTFGVPGEIAGMLSAEPIAKATLGTKARSAVGSKFQNFSKSGELPSPSLPGSGNRYLNTIYNAVLPTRGTTAKTVINRAAGLQK